MRRVSKVSFWAAISSAPSLLCAVMTVHKTSLSSNLDEWMSEVHRITAEGFDLRTVAASRDTFLEFSNGSRLYHETGTEYWRHGSALAVVRPASGDMVRVILYHLHAS